MIIRKVILILIIFSLYISNTGCEKKEKNFTVYKEKMKRKEPIKKRLFPKWEKEYDKAREFVSQEKYEKAIAIYQRIMKKYPEDKRGEDDFYKDKHIYFEIASCYEGLHQFSRAYQIYSDLIRKYKEDEVVITNAKYRKDFIDKYKLVEIEEKRKKSNISEADYLLKLVNVFIDEGRDRPQILPLIEKAFRLDPNHPEILLRVAQVYDKEANKILHHNNPNDKEYLKGKSYKDDAINILYRIIREYPDSEFADDAQYELGEQNCDPVTVWDNDYKQAIREYEKLIDQYPKSNLCPKAKLRIGDCYRMLESYYEAIHAYKKVIEDYPDTQEAILSQRYIGTCYTVLKDYEKAIEAYQRVINKFPKTEEASLCLLDMAEVYEKLADYNKAIELYEEYIRNYAKRKIDKEIYQERIMEIKKKL